MNDPAWVRSSHCSYNACVEVARRPEKVMVRDSQDPDGAKLEFGPSAWAAFTGPLKAV